jgi:hypothetical protein
MITIATVTYHGREPYRPQRACTIVLKNGTRLNAWYLPHGDYQLEHVNSLPRDDNDPRPHGLKYRERDIKSKWGQQLQAAFTVYSRAHEADAIKAQDEIEATKQTAERAKAQAETEAKVEEIAAVIRRHFDPTAGDADDAAREILQRWPRGF